MVGKRDELYLARQDRPWAYAGSDLADVVFGPGGSLYTYTKAREAGDWYEIDVPAPIATALATGDQFGLMLTDEKGGTRTKFAIGSREGGDPPVLIVEGTRASVRARPCARAARRDPPPSLGRTSLRPGSVILRLRERRGRALRAALFGIADSREWIRRRDDRAALDARPAGAQAEHAGHVEFTRRRSECGGGGARARQGVPFRRARRERYRAGRPDDIARKRAGILARLAVAARCRPAGARRRKRKRRRR